MVFESQFWRRYCQTFSTGFSSGAREGREIGVMLLGTSSLPVVCHPARSRSRTAWAAAAIILIGERHLIVIDGDKSRIGDRRAMRVAGEIGQYALGAAEGRLGVDDEGALPQRAHTFGERGGLGKRDQVAEETEFASTESGFQAVEEQTAEGVRQGADGEQEVGFASDPSPA